MNVKVYSHLFFTYLKVVKSNDVFMFQFLKRETLFRVGEELGNCNVQSYA